MKKLSVVGMAVLALGIIFSFSAQAAETTRLGNVVALKRDIVVDLASCEKVYKLAEKDKSRGVCDVVLFERKVGDKTIRSTDFVHDVRFDEKDVLNRLSIYFLVHPYGFAIAVSDHRTKVAPDATFAQVRPYLEEAVAKWQAKFPGGAGTAVFYTTE